MDWLIPAVAIFLIATTSSHLLSIAIVVTRVRRHRTPQPVAPLSAAVTIIRPVCGLENFIETILRSTFRLWAGKGFEWRGNSTCIVESKQSA